MQEREKHLTDKTERVCLTEEERENVYVTLRVVFGLFSSGESNFTSCL